MIGPTQAVSGLVAASVAVKEAISSMLGPEAPGSAPAEVNLARSIDELMTPDFTALIGPVSSPSGASGDVVPLSQSEAAASDASSQTGTQSSSANAGGAGSSGYQGGRRGFGLGGSGFGGMSGGGYRSGAGAFSQEIAETSSASDSSESVTDPISDDGLGHVPSIEDDARAFEPPASGAGPGSGGGPSPGDVDLPGPSGNQPTQPSAPTFSGNPPANGGGPSDSHPVPPSVLEPLLDELDVPPTIAGPNPLRRSPAGLDEPGVFQIAEPSTMALFAIGTAVAVRRRARRRAQ
jgi:hypothetical protein